MNYYEIEKLSEHRRSELERRLSEKVKLQEAGVATGLSIRTAAARALLALAHRLDPHLAALQVRQGEVAHRPGC